MTELNKGEEFYWTKNQKGATLPHREIVLKGVGNLFLYLKHIYNSDGVATRHRNALDA
mgnify:CR=1 FL=1